MKSSNVRQSFVDYFKKQGHAHVASSSLVPENDPTLLFANAGMNQFKNVFLGLENRDYTRAVTSQKCVRAGGKHNDLENVGFTARHHTFFEMLGNFSFGDYFKKDAIHFAWDLLTKDLGIPKEKLYVTVFESDDEAADIWHKQEGVPKDRIFRLGEKDNFWRMGDTGPCGPCSEIFYDHGAHAGKESDPFKGIVAGEDRFVEIWNLVFMQFYESAPGKMQPLPKPSVDTGSGLERVCAALQGKLSNYDTDLFWPLILRSAEISGKDYLIEEIEKANKLGIHAQLSAQNQQDIAALRVIADHIRSASFLIADGALPSNEGRGYVLRRILRRAIRFAQKVSGGKSFLPEISKTLIANMQTVYPELQQRSQNILMNIKDEEDRFSSTLSTGTEILNQELSRLKSNKQKNLPGDVVFKLYDTYGFPVDLTRLMSEEQGVQVNEQEFEQKMQESRAKAKASWKGKGISSDEAHLVSFAQSVKDQGSQVTQFTGYESLTGSARILGLSDGKQIVKKLSAGQSGLLILDKTPFYAEGGGQAADQGTIKTKSASVQVYDCKKNLDLFLHFVEVSSGEISVGEQVETLVQESERRNTAANHSATHLLHSALRKVLGEHVTQAGQMVDAQRIRFDFTHNKPVSSEQLLEMEDLVNHEVSLAQPVTATLMGHKQALQSGAIALFGEKYGDEVRVLKMGDFSTELCGGTHVSNTSQIRVFKIVSESGVSSGVRRIEALAGDRAIQYMFKNTTENQQAKQAAGIQGSWENYFSEEAQLPKWVEEKKQEIKNLQKEVKKAQGGQVDLAQILQQAESLQTKKGKAQLVYAELPLEDRDVLAQSVDHLKNKIDSGVVIILGQGDSSRPLIVSVTKNLNPEISAGTLLKEFSQVLGGKGGGRPDFAQGSVPGGKPTAEAVQKIKQLLQ